MAAEFFFDYERHKATALISEPHKTHKTTFFNFNYTFVAYVVQPYFSTLYSRELRTNG